jgi:arylsulfatase A-like enzyme
VKEEGYTTDLVADAAASFIRQHKDNPFLCYVAFTAPHDPLQVPDKYLAQYAALDPNPGDGKPSPKQKLAGMITCMDDGIGRILKAVEEAGIAKDTLVLFMSDNGGVRGIPQANAPLRDGKLTVYEGGVRVPAAAWWPGVIEGGRKISTPVMFIDVMPTLLRVCGGAPGKELDGADVFDLLTGKAPGREPRRDLYFFHAQGVPGKEQLAVSSADGWKLVVIGPDVRREAGHQTPQHTVELFHLTEDPLEKQDLAAREPVRVKELAAKLVEFRKSEPADAMTPVNQKPAGFAPPPQWRNVREK